METLTVTIQQIREQGQRVAKDAAQWIEADAYRRVPAGEYFAQQGDIYLKKLLAVPSGAVEVVPFLQLAPGESLGSRHCLGHLDGIKMYLMKDPSPLDGPIIECFQPQTVTHPMHGDICGIPAGSVFQVMYQRLYGDTVRRVQD